MNDVADLNARRPADTVAVPRAWIDADDLNAADLGVLIRIATLLEYGRPITMVSLTRPGQAIDSTRRTVNRLIDAGYVSRTRIVTSARFRGVRYAISDPE